MKMNANKKTIAQAVLMMAFTVNVYVQAPSLPPTNLGLANVYDGMAGKPGFVYQGFLQSFQTRAIYDPNGHKTPSDLKVNSILQMNQFLYLAPAKVLDGNLGFTVLIPIVQISASSATGAAPSTNPGVIGDPIAGVAIQWSDKHLFGRPFAHRLEFDLSVPVGNYDNHYAINPSAHLWSYEMYYALTFFINKQMSFSTRNELNYNSSIIGTPAKPGAYYNGNYSIDYSILPAVKIEAVAYYLQQLVQDSYNGDHHYYQDRFGIPDTKERLLSVGPGLVYFTPRGILLEAKVFFETDAKNTLAGTRTTLRITVPLSKP